MATDSKPRIILDTNVIISGVLFKGAVVRRLLLLALNEYQLVFSQATWDELAVVLQRDNFEKHMPLGARLRVLADLAGLIEVVSTTSIVADCRDPKDNKFLAVAVAVAVDAGVSTIVTGDADLLVLNPYKGVSICTPAGFMQGR